MKNGTKLNNSKDAEKSRANKSAEQLRGTQKCFNPDENSERKKG